jgi:hypothetical protein
VIPVKQTNFGDGGNCFAACIASLLHCSIDEVPETTGYGGLEQIFILNQWLLKKGLQYLVFHMPQELMEDFFSVSEGFYYILTIPVTETQGHCVVGQGGRIVFDPMGYMSISDYWVSLFARVEIGVLVPLRPWEAFEGRDHPVIMSKKATPLTILDRLLQKVRG